MEMETCGTRRIQQFVCGNGFLQTVCLRRIGMATGGSVGSATGGEAVTWEHDEDLPVGI
jgi:hypothetical protein